MNRTMTAPAIHVRLVGSFAGSAEKTIPVLGTRFLIGRDPACQLRPKSQMVSRRHAEIRIDGDEAVLRDLDSRNGTLLNGEPIPAPTPLTDGDRIQIGPVELAVSISQDEPGPAPRMPIEDQVANWLIDDEDAHPVDKTHPAR